MTGSKTGRGRGAGVLMVTAGAALVLMSGCAQNGDDLTVTGTVEAREVTVSARTPGEIVELAVEEGGDVDEGELIARIDDTELVYQRRQAEAGVELAEAELSLLLEGAAPEDVRQAEEAVAQAREELELARRNFERIADLFEAGSVSRSEYDTARARLNQARARFNSSEAALEKASGPARPAELRAARAKLARAEASLEIVKTRLNHTRITAPLSGTVVTTAREEGEVVGSGSPIAELADLSEVYVDVYVSEPRLADLRIGAGAVVSPDGTSQRLTGRVSFISPRAEFTPTNVQTDEQRAKLVYRVKVRVPNPQGVLKIGMPVEVDLDPEEDSANDG